MRRKIQSNNLKFAQLIIVVLAVYLLMTIYKISKVIYSSKMNLKIIESANVIDDKSNTTTSKQKQDWPGFLKNVTEKLKKSHKISEKFYL